MIKIETQKNASNKIRSTKIKIVIPIQSNIDIISPPIPSPTSILGKLGAVPELEINSPVLEFAKLWEVVFQSNSVIKSVSHKQKKYSSDY